MRFSYRHISSVFICALFILSACHSYAQSGKHRSKSFTKDNVTAFIEDTTALTAKDSSNKNLKFIRKYLDRHIDSKARFKTNIVFIVPGMEETTRSLVLGKQDYIQQVEEGADAVEDYFTDISIQDIDISEDEKTASVKTISSETGLMQVPNPDGSVDSVPIFGQSDCFQVLKIGRKGYIQMLSASCETRMEFQNQ
ncbi:MAG: hypothetical protein AB8B83_05750 [Bdellovibrionales bacterium]